MPAKKAFPSGALRVLKKQTSDVTAGLSFRPLDAEQIRYLWVSGIIQIGTVEAAYDFTLIEYKLHIDETPWIIYSTLVNALETEFFEDFWDVVNYRRKGPTELLHGWNKKTHMMSPQHTWTHEFLFWTKTGTPPR